MSCCGCIGFPNCFLYFFKFNQILVVYPVFSADPWWCVEADDGEKGCDLKPTNKQLLISDHVSRQGATYWETKTEIVREREQVFFKKKWKRVRVRDLCKKFCYHSGFIITQHLSELVQVGWPCWVRQWLLYMISTDHHTQIVFPISSAVLGTGKQFFQLSVMHYLRWTKSHIDCGITYCIRNEEVVSQQSVMQQGGNDTLQPHWAPVALQGGHPYKQWLVARPESSIMISMSILYQEISVSTKIKTLEWTNNTNKRRCLKGVTVSLLSQ